MDPFLLTAVLGGAGLAVMALGGVGHHSHAGRGGHTHHTGHSGHTGGAQGHGPARGGAAHTGHGPQAHHAHHAHHAHAAGHETSLASRWVLPLLSPRALFALSLGFGVTGLAVRHTLGGAFLWLAAAAGALVFELGLMQPSWRFFSRFGSAPAVTLEQALFDEALAASAFDADGHGLVALELDGQVVQLLGTLRPEDRTAGIRVRSGDRLRIEAVDEARSRCTVSRLG